MSDREKLVEENKNGKESVLSSTSIEDDLNEWNDLLLELSNKEIKFDTLKKDYQVKSEELLKEASKIKAETERDIIKEKYGGNNDKTRKQYVKDSLKGMSEEKQDLEYSIDYLKRRMSFLKALVYSKRTFLEIAFEKKEWKL